ncbi:sensor histidine kinase [Streptomyces sp. NPDC006923]|uniref:sensor histidine kinase n=1 Tax=Streptomyces sp. NPDC006923 TaxID=3155355 RepID=UPI0033C83A73
MERIGAQRLSECARAAPRALREDLWTVAADPLPTAGRPRWLDWLPAFMVPLVLLAAFITVNNVDELAWTYDLGISYALLLGGLQSAALVVAVFRPVPAWWAATILMVVVARVSEPRISGSEWYPWTGPGIALQAGVLFLLALRARPRTAAEALVISVLAGLACEAFTSQAHNSVVGSAVAVFSTAVVLGAALRAGGVARSRLAAQQEITAEERARRTLLEERNRIARELHDVVAHHMSVISIQAQAAPHLVENPSDELRENLAGIRQNAVEALTELRTVLGVLRSEDARSADARHDPQPTLGRLDELVGNVRGAGLAVTTRTTGRPRPLPPGVELSAFRIVQEALSNALRHAPGAEVRVEIGYRPAGVTVRVTNTAPDRAAPPSPGIGHGLLGMRERTAMLGGELATGATPDGGYEVTAMLPAKAHAERADPAEDTS